jgi:DegV family protein with EDD domain
MNRVAIIADSIACLPRDMVEQYDIEIVSPNIYVNGQVYRDWVDISPSEAYQLLEKAPESFSTSGPPPAAFVEAYRKLSRGAESILCITLSSKVSTVYNAALAAREQVERELPGTTIEVVDSGTATGAEGFVVLAAARAAAQGKTLVEAVDAAEEVRHKVDLLFALETIRHAYRTGRIPKVATQLGAWLSVKPLLTWENGVARLIGMTRNKEKAVNQLLEEMHKRVRHRPVHVAVHHAGAAEEGERLKERVQREFACLEVWITELSPIMGYSTGTGALGLAFYTQD